MHAGRSPEELAREFEPTAQSIKEGSSGNKDLYILEDIGTKTLAYLYDFGDGWEHTIKIEHLADPEPGVLYPRLIEVSGRCPPEDCGGPWGYAELLEAIKDPKHERHAELTEWIGYDFDPDADDAEGLSAEVAALAKAWSRKPTSKRTRRR